MPDQLLDQAQQALSAAQAGGADQTVVGLTDTSYKTFTYRDGKLEKVQHNASRGLSLQLYVDGRYSTHGTTDLRPDQLKTFAAEAIGLTRHLEPDPHRRITDPALYHRDRDADLDLVDPDLDTLDRDTCLEWLGQMDAANHDGPKVISATGTIYWGRRSTARVSSNGFLGQTANTFASWSSSVTLDEGNGKRPSGSHYVGGSHREDLPEPVQVARKSLERAQRRLGSTKAPSARTNLVVAPEAGGELLGRLESALSAGAIQQNRSFLADKKGQTIANPCLSMTDDPLRKRGHGSRLYDGEGIAARVMPLVEAGVLREYFVDTYYGSKLNWAPTTGGSSNMVFAPGDKDLDGLVNDVGEGFYVDSWLGGNADMTSGDFSFGFGGHRISRGQLAEPVAEMNLSGNYLDLLQGLVQVGNDPHPWSSWRTPTLVFQNAEFSGT